MRRPVPTRWWYVQVLDSSNCVLLTWGLQPVINKGCWTLGLTIVILLTNSDFRTCLAKEALTEANKLRRKGQQPGTERAFGPADKPIIQQL